MKSLFNVPVVLICALSAPAIAAEQLDFDNETTRINYSLGYQIGGDFLRQGVEMDAEAVVQGINDALTGAKPQMTPAKMNATLVELKKKVVAEQNKRRKQTEFARLEEGKQYMEENGKKEGVITTDSGLQYSVVKAGTGRSPGPQDAVTVHYRGTLIDGKEFDSSYKKGEPATFKLNSVIKGWSEGLQLMKEGGKSQFVIPSNLAYGDRGPLGNYTLLFDVELIAVGEPAQSQAQDQKQGQ